MGTGRLLPYRECQTADERMGTVETALEATGGNVTAAAGDLGISRRHLTRLTRPAPSPAGLVKLSLELPRDVAEWLEVEALRRKHRDGGRWSKSPIVVEAVRALMAQEQGR